MLKKRIGQRIQELRIKCGYKQAELAEKVNIATKHQSCIETGKNFPSAELLEKYSVALDTDLAELLNIREIKPLNLIQDDINKILSKLNESELRTLHKILYSLYY